MMAPRVILVSTHNYGGPGQIKIIWGCSTSFAATICQSLSVVHPETIFLFECGPSWNDAGESTMSLCRTGHDRMTVGHVHYVALS